MKQAIYREFRPKDFTHVVGQDHIVEILKNQIKTGNLGHAYLFSGIRGTGKTSCAKIFARAVNCLNPIDGNPCNECENCKMILNDKALEVVEMDAASNRRIDDIRELKEKVIYPPQLVKYKVYIIDEAHMITNEGFNALLKILEEPPKHLIFILATTEIDKLPDTIISRCQRFEFKRIENEKIIENINYVLKSLNVEIEKEGINLIAELSFGAMRDALSLLDQVISTGKEKISVEDINECLGLINLNTLFSFSKSIAEKQSVSAIENYRNLVKNGKTPYNIITDLIKHFRNILLVKSIEKKLTNLNEIEFKKYFEHAEIFQVEELIFILENLLSSEEKMKKSDMQNAIAELSIIKICAYIKQKTSLELRIETLENIIKNKSYKNCENIEVSENSNPEKNEFFTFEDTGEKILADKKYSKNEDYKTTLEKESEKENIDTKTEPRVDLDIVTEVKDTKLNENITCNKIDLTSFKDVVKNTIFKRTISKLFDESVKKIEYYSVDNFLQIECKEYLFKFGSYNLDEHNSFDLNDIEMLNEFFTKTNLPKKNNLKVFAHFI